MIVAQHHRCTSRSTTGAHRHGRSKVARHHRCRATRSTRSSRIPPGPSPYPAVAIPENWLPHEPNTDRGRYADTRTSLPVDNHGHHTDFWTWTFTREHCGQRRPDSTHMPSLPDVMLGLLKRRHLAVRSPKCVFDEIRCYPSPA
jgi:hypothetical protein